MSDKKIMIIDSLRNKAVDFILTAENTKEAMSCMWMYEGLIPQIITERMKNAKIEDKIIYSFNRDILENVWGCPKQFLNKYADDSNIFDILKHVQGFNILKAPIPLLELIKEKNMNINKLLDDVIFGDRIDIMDIPDLLLEMLNKRDLEICNSKEYTEHFEYLEM